MRRILSALLIALAAWSPARAADAPAPPMKVGVNLLHGGYDQSAMQFADVMRKSSGFWFAAGKSPGLDADGWPLRADAATGMAQATAGVQMVAPPGDYTLMAEGKGELWLRGDSDATRRFVQPGPLKYGDWYRVIFDGKSGTVTIPAGGVLAGSIAFQLRASDPADHLRNIRLYLPGHGPGDTWNRDYVAFLKGFSGPIRTMDWAMTNNSQVTTWTSVRRAYSVGIGGEAPTADRPFFGGYPPELFASIANATGRDLWVCLPAMCDDDYIRKLAALLDGLLDKGLVLIVEDSNETWNDGFPQRAWLRNQMAALGISGDDGIRWIAQRAARRTTLFRDSVAKGRRCRRVFATVAANINRAKVELAGLGGANPDVDVVAIAPYFQPDAKPFSAYVTTYAADPAGTLDALFADMEKALATRISWTADFAALAAKSGKALALYEGGQHLQNWTVKASAPLIAAANLDPRMGTLYGRQLDGLAGAGVEFACLYGDLMTYSEFGAWGLAPRLADAGTAPKAVATFAWIAAHPAPPPVVIPPTVVGVRVLLSDGTTRDLDAAAISALPGPVVTPSPAKP
jgi:hypothetical protein